jgi:hypothetical protein
VTPPTDPNLAEKAYQSFVARLESGQRRVDVVELVQLAEILRFDAREAIKVMTAHTEIG